MKASTVCLFMAGGLFAGVVLGVITNVAQSPRALEQIQAPPSAQEFVYDGCEYITFAGYHGVTHKGNCTNVVHHPK